MAPVYLAYRSHSYYQMASLESFITRKVVVLREDAPAHQAARAMCDQNIGCVVVCDNNGHMTGVVTDRDLACFLLTDPNQSRDVRLADIMTPEPITIDEDATLEEVAQMMEDSGVRRIPIVHSTLKNATKCVGIISTDDLIVSKMISLDQLSRIIGNQVSKRGPNRLQTVRSERAGARSEAHIEQTLNHFHNVMAQKTRLNADLVIRVTKFILESMVGRLHYKGAAHFIAQLPKGLQEDLLDLPAGPNRGITGQSLLTGIMSRVACSETQARWIFFQFFDALSELIDRKATEYVWAQLPQDMRLVFGDSAIVKEFKKRPAVA